MLILKINAVIFAISYLPQQLNILLVAHRLSALQECDLGIKLEN